MASDPPPPAANVKVKKRRKWRVPKGQRKEFQAVDIEEFTSAGHRALQEGRTEDALNCFNDALKVAGQVRLLRVKGQTQARLDCRKEFNLISHHALLLSCRTPRSFGPVPLTLVQRTWRRPNQRKAWTFCVKLSLVQRLTVCLISSSTWALPTIHWGRAKRLLCASCRLHNFTDRRETQAARGTPAWR